MEPIIPLSEDDTPLDSLRKTASNIRTHAMNGLRGMDVQSAANLVSGAASLPTTAAIGFMTDTDNFARQQGITNNNPSLLRDMAIRAGGMANRITGGAVSGFMNVPLLQQLVNERYKSGLIPTTNPPTSPIRTAGVRG